MNVTQSRHKKAVFKSGVSHSEVTTEAGRFSKKPAEVTGGAAASIEESVTLSDGKSDHSVVSFDGNAPSGHLTYSNLSAEDKADARRIMKELNQNARLFARNEADELVRVTPAGAKELLDGGEEVEVVTRLASQSESRRSSSSTDLYQENFFNPADRHHASNSTSSSTVKVEYTSSPISEWDSVLWHDGEDFQGVAGTPKLPASGSPVTISNEWESNWKKSSEEHSGFFRHTVDSSASSGYESFKESVDA